MLIRISKLSKLVLSYQVIFLATLVLVPVLISVSFGYYSWPLYQILLYISLFIGLNLKLKNKLINNQDNHTIKEYGNLNLFIFLLLTFSFIQISQSIYYFIQTKTIITPATKYLLFNDVQSNLWRYYSIFLAIKNSFFFYLTYSFTTSKFKISKYLKYLLFGYLLLSALYLLYIDGLGQVGYTWPIFFSLIFKKIRKIFKRSLSGRLSYRVLILFLIPPLLFYLDDLIGNKLLEIGAPQGFTIIQFDPKGIINNQSNSLMNILSKSQLVSMIYYYGLEMFNSAKLITSIDSFCFYFLIPISKVSSFFSQPDACYKLQQTLFDNKLLGAWTMMGTLIGSKLSFLGVITYGFLFGTLLSIIVDFIIKLELYFGLKNDPIGFSPLIQISSISSIIINPDLVTYISIFLSAILVSMVGLIKFKKSKVPIYGK